MVQVAVIPMSSAGMVAGTAGDHPVNEYPVLVGVSGRDMTAPTANAVVVSVPSTFQVTLYCLGADVYCAVYVTSADTDSTSGDHSLKVNTSVAVLYTETVLVGVVP